MAADLESTPQRRPRWWLRISLALLVFLAVTIVALWINNEVIGVRGQSQLNALIAQIESDDPRWKLEQIVDDRPILSNPENSTLVLHTVVKTMAPWGADDLQMPDGKGLLDELPANHLLSDERRAKLLAAVRKQSAALALAVSLRDLPRGRAPLRISPDYIGTLLPYAQEARDVARLLDLDAERLILENRPAEVADRIVAILRAGESLREEPFLISQMVRNAVRSVAAQRIERMLAQTQPPAEVCQRLRKEIHAQRRENLLLTGLRGERAGVHHLFENLQRRVVTLDEFLATIGNTTSNLDRYGIKAGAWLYGSRLTEDHANALRWFNRACAIACLPAHEQRDAWKDYDREFRVFVSESRSRLRNIVTTIILPAAARVSEAFLRDQAYLSCVESALAAEEYRLQHGSWPKSLHDLVPTFFDAVLLDPYTGKPLLYRTEGEGIILYTVGQDGTDDGGKKLRLRNEPGSDVGVRVWNVAQRRLPAR